MHVNRLANHKSLRVRLHCNNLWIFTVRHINLTTHFLYVCTTPVLSKLSHTALFIGTAQLNTCTHPHQSFTIGYSARWIPHAPNVVCTVYEKGCTSRILVRAMYTKRCLENLNSPLVSDYRTTEFPSRDHCLSPIPSLAIIQQLNSPLDTFVYLSSPLERLWATEFPSLDLSLSPIPSFAIMSNWIPLSTPLSISHPLLSHYEQLNSPLETFVYLPSPL